MEYATDSYKEAMKANVRGKSYVWVSLDLVNTYAQDSAYISSAFTGSENGIYDDSIILNSVTSREADGSITFTFGEYTKILLSGIRFILNGQYETVTATNGSQSKTIAITNEEMEIDKVFSNCHYIKLTPDSGNLSIKKIYFGKIVNFDHDEIMNTSRSNTIRHLNEELPEKSFSCTVHNYDRLWSKDNPDSYARFVMPKQKITYTYGRDVDGDIYKIQGGVAYIRDFSSDDYKATFAAVGLLDFIQADYTKGAFYPDGITLYQLAELVLIDAGIKNYELDACLRSFKVTNPLPLDTHKACLQLIAHAGRCILYEDRNGAVCIKSADRPVIYKTGYVINATNFSSGDDVVNPMTTANYASTEPNYTYADGLHYFYPEDGSEGEISIDTSVDYIPLPAPRPFIAYYENAIWKKYYFTGNKVTIYGVTFTIDNSNNSIHITGQNNYIDPMFHQTGELYFTYYDESNNVSIPDGDYVFGAAKNINLSVGDKYCKCEFWYSPSRTFEDTYEASSNSELKKRLILDQEHVKLYQFYVQIGAYSQPLDYTFYPKLYKVNRGEGEVPSSTLPVGFVSKDFANSSGTFKDTPEIKIVFASQCKLSDIVMNCAVPPKDFTIKCYLGDTQVATRSITNNTDTQIEISFSDIVCDRFTVTFTKTTPGQRIHVNSVEPIAAFDYEITYKDLTTNPIATEIEKVSYLKCEVFKYKDPGNGVTSLGGMSVNTESLESGGLAVNINSGSGVLAYVDVTKGENTIDIGNPSIVNTVEYADDGEAGTVEIIDKGAYFVKVNASRDGYVNVKGVEYFENIVNHIIPVDEIGEEVTVSNPLISTEEHYEKLKSWFLDYYENDIQYRFDYRGDPILDADDQIFLENKFVTNNLVRIETEELSTSAGMDTSNQIVARRMKYTTVSKTVLRDFVLSNDTLYLDNGQNAVLSVMTWIPETATNKTITWSSSDSSVVSVDRNGRVMPVAVGEATITARSSNGIVHTCHVISTASMIAVTDFTLSDSEMSVGVGSTKQLYVSEWVPDNASLRTVEWSSSDESVATVDSYGNVTAVGEGDVIITATCPDGISKTCEITADVIEATDFVLSATTASMEIGDTKQLSIVSWTPADASDKTVTWSSSDDTKATVSNGLITAIGEGNVTITATSADGISKTCALSVSHVEVTDFTLSPSSMNLQIGQTMQLNVIQWFPYNATYKTITWTSSNTNIATVSENGIVTAVANGDATITATCPDGVSKTCAVTIADIEVVDFTLSSSSETVLIGETLQLLVVSWIPSNATHRTVTWTSSDPSVASVSADGIVTGITDGSVTITATCPDGISKICNIEVPYIEVTDFRISATSARLTAGDTLQLSILSYTPADATDPSFTWSSSDTSIATVSNTGLVTALVDGTVTITATCADGISKTCKIVIAAIAVTDFTLSSSSETVDMGDTFTLSVVSWTPQNATRKTVTWESSDTSKATVSAAGVVTTLGVGNVTITATCPDGISKTCAVVINAVAVTDFTLSQTSATVDVGDTLQLSVTSWTPNNATYKTVTWTSSDTTKATVSADGIVSGVARGNVTITATCPDGISKTCAITVYQYVPVTDFTLSSSSASLSIGDTLQLSVTSWTPSDATDKTVTWSSSDTTKATVSSSGLVTSVGVGNATITATCHDRVSKTCVLTVSGIAVESVSLSANTLNLSTSGTATLTATVLPANATNKSVTWSSSNTSIATVSNGVVTAGTNGGSCTVTVTTVDGGKTDTCTVNVIVQSQGTYYNYPAYGTAAAGSYPIDFILVQKDRRLIESEDPYTAMLISKTVFNNGASYDAKSNVLYKDSSMDTKLRSIYNNNFSTSLKNCLESYTDANGRFDFMVANSMTNHVISWTSERLPVCASNAFDFGILHKNDAETETVNNQLVAVYNECTYIQNNPNVVNALYHPDYTVKSGSSPVYNNYYFLSTMEYNSKDYKVMAEIYNSNNTISIVATTASSIGSLYFRITVAISPDAKVYATPQSDGAYVLDFNNLSSSIAIKDLPLGTVIRDVPYNV